MLFERVCKIIEKTARFLIIKIFKLQISELLLESIIQFAKYAVVGVVSNAVYYLVYILLVFRLDYFPSNIIGFIASVIISYLLNNRYVFSEEEKRIWWKTFCKTSIAFIFTGVIMSNILLFLFIEKLGISEYISPLIGLVILIPLNYIINKYWAYKGEK